MPESIERSTVLPAPPEAIYDAWLDGPGHSAMTGSPATSDPVEGGRFTAWNGFIEGTWQTLERPRRLAMAWSTSAFPEGAPPSHVDVALEPVDGGTRVIIRHRDIPDGQGDAYFGGWHEKYFAPMARHFGP